MRTSSKQRLTYFLSYISLTLCIIRRKKWTGVTSSFHYVYSRKGITFPNIGRVLTFYSWREDKEPSTAWQRPSLVGMQWPQELGSERHSLKSVERSLVRYISGPAWSSVPKRQLQRCIAASCSQQSNSKYGNHTEQRTAQPPDFDITRIVVGPHQEREGNPKNDWLNFPSNLRTDYIWFRK